MGRVDNMTKDIKIGSNIEFNGTVDMILYDKNGKPSEYTLVTHDKPKKLVKVSVYPEDDQDSSIWRPEVPYYIAHLLNPYYKSEIKKHGFAQHRGYRGYDDFLRYLHDFRTPYTSKCSTWIGKHEATFCRAYCCGFTVASENRYLYPVPHAGGDIFYAYTFDRSINPITKDSILATSEYDPTVSDMFKFTEYELSILGVSLDDAQLVEE